MKTKKKKPLTPIQKMTADRDLWKERYEDRSIDYDRSKQREANEKARADTAEAEKKMIERMIDQLSVELRTTENSTDREICQRIIGKAEGVKRSVLEYLKRNDSSRNRF